MQLWRSRRTPKSFVCSHDLQEPLRSITSFCNLLKEDYEGRLDEQADTFIARIVSGAKRMKALIPTYLLTRASTAINRPRFTTSIYATSSEMCWRTSRPQSLKLAPRSSLIGCPLSEEIEFNWVNAAELDWQCNHVSQRPTSTN